MSEKHLNSENSSWIHADLNSFLFTIKINRRVAGAGDYAVALWLKYFPTRRFIFPAIRYTTSVAHHEMNSIMQKKIESSSFIIC